MLTSTKPDSVGSLATWLTAPVLFRCTSASYRKPLFETRLELARRRWRLGRDGRAALTVGQAAPSPRRGRSADPAATTSLVSARQTRRALGPFRSGACFGS